MLREKAFPSAQQELDALLVFARAQGFQGDRFQVWDVPFWSERLRESKYGYEEEQLRPYFPLENVLTGLFSLAERLFSVKIEAADGQAEVWCPDVRFFNVREATTGAHIASFYLDPYSRPAEKRGGAWMNICLQKSRALKRIPVAYLICNGSPPVEEKPSLMTFSEVQTLFHGKLLTIIVSAWRNGFIWVCVLLQSLATVCSIC
jgi:oligopeptidase A